MRTINLKFSDYEGFDFNDFIDISDGVIVYEDIRDFDLKRYMEFLKYQPSVRPLARLFHDEELQNLGYSIHELKEDDQLLVRALVECNRLDELHNKLDLITYPFDGYGKMVIYRSEENYTNIYNVAHELCFYLIESDELGLSKAMQFEEDVLTDEIVEALLDDFDIFDDDEIILDLDNCEYLRNDTSYEVK